ncbi:MAG: hypothetical protein AB7R55_17330 [Gemmatimonadales bacterium]
MATHILIRSRRTELAWAVARWAALLAVPGLVAWLLLSPDAALAALWYVAIPVLPATFFVNTALWRGVCPLATLNELGNRIGTQREIPARVAGALGVVGLALFHLLVPARRFLFNTEAPALIGAVAGVGVLAVALGAVYAVRSGFCNGLCPVLPVELLYGQAPLVPIARGRCSSCAVCTPRACLDLAQARAPVQALGPSRRSAAWLLTPFGAFAAGLPGFIVGYSLTPDGPLSTAPAVYAATLGGSLASFLAVAVVVAGVGLTTGVALPGLGAAAGGLYYWFAGPAIAGRFSASASVATGIRAVGLALVAAWLATTLWRSRPQVRLRRS